MNEDTNSGGKGVDDSINKKPKCWRRMRLNEMRKHYAKKKELQNNLHLSMQKEIESTYDSKKNMTPTILMKLSLKNMRGLRLIVLRLEDTELIILLSTRNLNVYTMMRLN